MRIRITCSWCHELGEPGAPCVSCGHDIGRARLDCRCRRCRQTREAIADRLADDGSGIDLAALAAEGPHPDGPHPWGCGPATK